MLRDGYQISSGNDVDFEMVDSWILAGQILHVTVFIILNVMSLTSSISHSLAMVPCAVGDNTRAGGVHFLLNEYLEMEGRSH